MGLFDAFKKKPTGTSAGGPYRNPAFNKLYNLLFCDNPALFNFPDAATTPPWDSLFGEQLNVPVLENIARDQQIESRIRILAYNKLRLANHPVPDRDLLAVI